MRKLCGLLLFAASCLGAWADAPAAKEQIVVTASRIESPALTAPGYVTTITAQQIAHSTATSLAGVLQSATGVEIHTTGPAGSLATVSLQGATSSQVLVLLNGVRLNTSLDGLVDLSQIPLDSIERIEIVRGGDSALYGTNAIGGVINIITKTPTRDALEVHLLNGSYVPISANEVTAQGTVAPAPANPLALVDTQKLDANVQKVIGPVGVRGGISAERAANQYSWFDSTGIDSWRTMSNAGYLAGSGSGGVTFPLLGATVDLSGEGGWSSEQVPPIISSYLYPSQALQTETFAHGSVRLRSPALGALPVSTDLQAYYRYRTIDYTDPLATPTTADSQLRNSVGADLTQHLRLSDAASITWDGLFSYDAVNSTEVGNRGRLNAAGGALLSYAVGDLFTLTPALRYDWFDDFGGHLSYSLAGVLPVGASQALKLVLASSYRVPALYDLYYPLDGYGDVGNPNLIPESSYSGQLGYSVQAKAITADAYLFSRYTLNQIIWSFSSATGLYSPQNVGVTFDGGLDAHLAVSLFRNLTISAGYTFLYSLVLADQNGAHTIADNLRVPYSPLNTVKAAVAYRIGPSTVGADLAFMSSQFTDTSNVASALIPSSTMIDANYSLQIDRNLVLQVSGKNLLNRAWVTQPGYVTPPLSLWIGVSASY